MNTLTRSRDRRFLTLQRALFGRNVLVTQAHRAFGRAVALKAAAAGATVFLVGRAEAKLRALAREIRARAGLALVYLADLNSRESRDALYATLARHSVDIDVVVEAGGQGVLGLMAPDTAADAYLRGLSFRESRLGKRLLQLGRVLAPRTPDLLDRFTRWG